MHDNRDMAAPLSPVLVPIGHDDHPPRGHGRGTPEDTPAAAHGVLLGREGELPAQQASSISCPADVGTRQARTGFARWTLWTRSSQAIAWILTVDVVAVTLAALTIVQSATPSSATWWWTCALLVAAIGHMAAAVRAEERRRERTRLTDVLHVDLTSVWTFAAAVVLAPAQAVLVVVVVRALIARIRRRSPHQVVYGSASVLLTVLLAHLAVVALVPTGRIADGILALPELIVVLSGCGIYWAVETVLIGQILRLTTSPRPTWRAAAGSLGENSLEICTLLAGALVATSGWWWAALLAAGPVAAATIAADRHAQLGHDARTDPLTRLLNRDGWAQACARLWTRTSSIGVYLIDLDHFKSINDNYGHPAGDAVLVRVAAVMVDKLRDDAVVARVGGEELAVAVAVADDHEAEVIAERLRAAIASDECRVHVADNNGKAVVLTGRGDGAPVFENNGCPAYDSTISARRAISASIGVAVSSPVLPTVELLLAAADRAVYDAKKVRNSVAIFRPSPDGPAARPAPTGTPDVVHQPV